MLSFFPFLSSGFIDVHTNNWWGCPRGVMVKAMDWGIVVSEFVLQSRYYIHFWANTLGKGMNPLKRVDIPLNKETKSNQMNNWLLQLVILT